MDYMVLKLQAQKMDFLALYTIVFLALIIKIEAIGRPASPVNNVGEYGLENIQPKPYSFNYEVTDEKGNIHFRREQTDPSGIVTGSYGYMKVNGLYRSVEYMAGADGFKAKVKTNEPGTKGPGSADVELQAEPSPIDLAEMFERKSPSAALPARRRYPRIKG